MEEQPKQKGKYSNCWESIYRGLSARETNDSIIRIVYDLRDGKITEQEGRARLDGLIENNNKNKKQ